MSSSSSTVGLPRHRGLGGVIMKIAKSRQLKTTDVKGVLDDIWAHAYADVKKNREVAVPGFMPLKLKPQPARKASTMVMSARTLNDPSHTLPDETL